MQFALFWFTGNNYGISARFRESTCFRIDPEVSLPTLGIRPVAGITVIRKNGSDIMVVINRRLRRFTLFRRYRGKSYHNETETHEHNR